MDNAIWSKAKQESSGKAGKQTLFSFNKSAVVPSCCQKLGSLIEVRLIFIQRRMNKCYKIRSHIGVFMVSSRTYYLSYHV